MLLLNEGSAYEVNKKLHIIAVKISDDEVEALLVFLGKDEIQVSHVIIMASESDAMIGSDATRFSDHEHGRTVRFKVGDSVRIPVLDVEISLMGVGFLWGNIGGALDIQCPKIRSRDTHAPRQPVDVV